MMTQGEALSTVQEHIELWDKRFPYEIKLILLRFHRPDKKFYRLEFEKSTFFTVADECVLMDMEGFITLLPGVPGENKVVRFEFEFGEKKETMAKIKTYAGVAVCPQCHNSINIQGATTTLGKISCKCGYEVQFDLGGKNGS